jgi:ribose 5-phosphate isomerase B
MAHKIAIGGDHAGYEYKKELVVMLQAKGYTVKDFGPFSTDSVDYPDYAHPLATAVENKEFDFGIILCGTGNGVNITVNKHQGIRSGLAWNTEVAALIRQHNDANILAIPARFVSLEQAKEFVEVFLKTPFEGGRHQNRVNKIPCM